MIRTRHSRRLFPAALVLAVAGTAVAIISTVTVVIVIALGCMAVSALILATAGRPDYRRINQAERELGWPLTQPPARRVRCRR